MRSLFDVNFLIALTDPDHANHPRAQSWWKINRHCGWASCPLTENGFVRVMSNPKYPTESSFIPRQLISDLLDFVLLGEHEFWHDDISLLDSSIFDSSRIVGPRQITDIYLLALTVKNGGRLVTFDERISIQAVSGATPDNLVIV